MSNFPQKITSVIKTFSSFIVVSLIAALVVSCASSSGGGGGGSAAGTGTGGGGGDDRVSVFSHSGYTFIPVDRNITLGDAPVTVGRVLVKNAEIRKLVATEINRLIDAGNSEAEKVEADDIGDAGKPNYTIKYSFVGADADDPNYDVNSVLNRYFEITPVDPNGGIIKVRSPYSFPVSLEDIFKDVSPVMVEVEVTITNPPNGVEVEKPLSYTVRVNFPGTTDTPPNIYDAVSFDLNSKGVSGKDDPGVQDIMPNQPYTGTLSGTLSGDGDDAVALNGTGALSFTSLWVAANAEEQTDPANGKILENTFVRGDLLNTAGTDVIQIITVTLTPPSGADIPDYVYASAATPAAPVSIEDLNGDNSIADSLLKAISDADVNEHYTMINADDIQVLNASIAWSFTYTYQRDFQPNPIPEAGKVELNGTAQFKEEQAVTATIDIDEVDNALNRYGVVVKKEEQRTVFFTLLESPTEPGSCANANIYLDNQNAQVQVKAGTSFNYEDLDTEAERQHKCVLGASFDGTNHERLTAVINSSRDIAGQQAIGQDATDCRGDADESCYYASLTVSITDVDEAPTIEERSDLSIAEGKGADPKYPGLNPVLGTLAPTPDNALAIVVNDITITDTDEAADGIAKLPVNVTETKVISVFPAHGAGLFSIDKTTGNNNHFTLSVNATELDYEKFVEEDDLNAAGKAIYMVTITTQDLPNDKEGFDKVIVKTMQVPVEITDVRYAPVPVATGFTSYPNIGNRSDRTIVLLPGASMLANGLNALGAVKAVNPETDSDKGLFYAVIPVQEGDSISADVAAASALHSPNFAVVTGLGDGTTPQNLILRGLSLVDGTGFPILVRAVYQPADFNSDDPSNIQTALGGTGVNIPISIVVEAGAEEYADLDLLNSATSPTFTVRQLQGSVNEGTAGDDFTGVHPVTNDDFSVLNPGLVNVPADLDIIPHFALVKATDFDAFGTSAELKVLGINTADSALFSINSSSGAISLLEESEVVFPVFYNLVVRLANASAGDAILLSHDYAVVTVLVNDENTAPELSDFTNFPTAVNGEGSFNNETGNALNITIDENTPVGTVLATFTVTDDNDGAFTVDPLTFAAATAADDFYLGAVELTFVPVAPAEGSKERTSTATLTLVKSLSFEDFAADLVTANGATITDTIDISDEGRYELNPLKGQTQPVTVTPPEPDSVLTTSLEFNLIVRDVAEKLLIDTASVTSGSISENSNPENKVAGIAIIISNINSTDASLVYELSGNAKFDEVFDVVVDEGSSNDNVRVLQLEVVDADALENLGDGQVHTSTLTIINNTSPQDKSDQITIQVKVNDEEQDITPITLSANTFAIAETDVDGGVADRTYEITDSLFTYRATDVSKDADDFVTIGGKRSSLVSVDYSITGVSFGSSTPDVAENIDSNSPPALSLKAPLDNGSVSLVVGDTDYIEASLFGTITATLNVTGTAIGRTVPFMNGDSTFTVTVAEAADKVVSYNTTGDNAPVYGFEYTQSEYAAEIAEGEAVLATTVNSENGLDSQVLIDVDGEKYNTTSVSVPGNTVNTYFIERSVSEDIVAIGDNMHAVHTGTLVIPFTSDEDITDVTEMQILSEDASGKLEDVTNFDNYFDIKVNNTYTLDAGGNTVSEHQVLLITQKQFDVINSSGVADAVIKYNALDTIPLFKGETKDDEETTRTYYIRASQGSDNASTYALAQFYVDVEAAGLNIPAKIEELYVNEVDIALDVDLGAAADINFNVDPEAGSLAGMINENGITQNNFDDYSLFINVSNNDYTENQVGGTTVITVSVPSDGTPPTDVTNPVDGSNKEASNNQLIALRTAGGSAAPLDANTNNVVITQDAGVYETHNIDFALARNVYGTATINIEIQENDASGSEIDVNDYEFTLTVNEDAGVNTPPTITPQLTAGASVKDPEAGTLNFLLNEDLDLLAGTSGDPSEKAITIAHGDVSANDAIRSQTGVITSINVAHDDNNPETNNRNKEVFTHTPNAVTMNYQEHGWGITDIAYLITETEPRGFGEVTATYTTDLPSRVTVTQVNDIATMHSVESVTFELSEFQVNDAFSTTENPDPKILTITYDDPDLKFADFPTVAVNNVLPEKIVAGVPVITPNSLDAALLIVPDTGSAPAEVSGSDTRFMVTFTTDFDALNSAQYTTINTQAVGANYAVVFAGNNVDAAENVPVNIPITTTVNNFVVQDASDAVFKSATITGEILPINEKESDDFVIATIDIEDLDFARPLPDAQKESIVFTIGTIEKNSGVSNLENKIEWSAPTINGTPDASSATERSNTITVDELDDTDVGTYTVNWMITQGLGTNSPLMGSFILDVQNVLEDISLDTEGVVTINEDDIKTLPTIASQINRTIATVSGITISGDDLNLPADAGYGILFTITPNNIESGINVLGYDADNATTVFGGKNRQIIDLVDVSHIGPSTRFGVTSGTKPSLTYFVKTSDIPENRELPAFNLLADEGVAGDEFNVTVRISLATGASTSGEVGTPITRTFETNYDIQSPPSVPTIATTGAFNGDSSDLVILENNNGNIVATFTDKNIDDGTLETFDSMPIEAFSANFKILGSDDTMPPLYDVNFTNAADFVATAGSNIATLTIPFAATNENAVGIRGYELTLKDSRTEDTIRTVTGNIDIQPQNSDVFVGIRLDTVLGTPQTLDNTIAGNDIRIVVNVTTEDFIEGDDNYEVTDITIGEVVFTMSIGGGDTFDCSAGSRAISSSDSERPTTFVNGGDDHRQALLLKVPLDEIDSSGTANCARLDADIVNVRTLGTVTVTLSNGRDAYTVPNGNLDTTNSNTVINDRDHVYQRTGIRLIAPSVAPVSPTASVATGGTVPIRFAVTDNDDDDNPPLGIQDARYGFELTTVDSAGGECVLPRWGTSTSTVSGGAYVYTVSVTAGTAVAGESCMVSVVASEDGIDSVISDVTTVTIANIPAPVIADATGSVVANLLDRTVGVSGKNLGTFAISRAAEQGLIGQFGLVLSVDAAVADSGCIGITITDGAQPPAGTPGSYSFNYAIDNTAITVPETTCTVTITATETITSGGSATFSTTKTVNITPRREIAPEITSLNAGSLAGITNYGLGTSDATKTFTVTAVVKDGDDDDLHADVSSTLNVGDTDICQLIDPAAQTSVALVDTLTWDVRVVGMAGQTCALTLTSTSSGLPPVTSPVLEVMLPPIAPTFTVVPAFAEGVTGTPVQVLVTITDTDNDGFGTTEVGFAPTASSDCVYEIISGANTGSQIWGVVSSMDMTRCIIAVTVTEDGTPTSAITAPAITFMEVTEIAPTITTSAVPATTVLGNTVQVTATIDDSDTEDGFDNAALTFTASTTGCFVNADSDLNFVSDSQATQVVNITTTATVAINCLIRFSATENGTGADEAPTTKVVRVPFVPPTPVVTGIKLPSDNAPVGTGGLLVNVTIEDVGPVGIDDDVIDLIVTGGTSDCSIRKDTEDYPLEVDQFRVNDIFQRIYVEATTHGTCTIAANTTRAGVESERFTTMTLDDGTVVSEIIFHAPPRIDSITLLAGGASQVSNNGDLTPILIDETVGTDVTLTVSISDTEDNGLSGANVIVNFAVGGGGASSNCRVDGMSDFTKNADGGVVTFVITADGDAATCKASIFAIEDGAQSTGFIPNPVITFTRGEVAPTVLRIDTSPGDSVPVGQTISATVHLMDNDPADGFGSSEITVETSSDCRVDGKDIAVIKNAFSGYASFNITAPAATTTCILTVGTAEDNGFTSSTSRPLTFTEPVDEGIVLAWSDQLKDAEFGGYMSIGDTLTSGLATTAAVLNNGDNKEKILIPFAGDAEGDTNFTLVPTSIATRLAMVQLRFASAAAIATNYGETIFAAADSIHKDSHNVINFFLPLLERGEYVSATNRDEALFYADTSSPYFNTTATNSVLTPEAKGKLKMAEIQRYLRFTTLAGGSAAQNMRSVATIPFAATYTGVERSLRNIANTGYTGNLSDTATEAGITDLINIDVSNVPAEGAKISASICRLTNFDGSMTDDADLNTGTCTTPADAQQTQRILLLGGYWNRTGDFATCRAGSSGGFHSWGQLFNVDNPNLESLYSCTANSANPKPLAGITHEKTLAPNSGDTTFPMHIRQFMNTNPLAADTTDIAKLNDYSLNEKNGYYLITIQAQDNSGVKIPDSNELKMLFHIGWRQ